VQPAEKRIAERAAISLRLTPCSFAVARRFSAGLFAGLLAS